jgi:hypothetical protein
MTFCFLMDEETRYLLGKMTKSITNFSFFLSVNNSHSCWFCFTGGSDRNPKSKNVQFQFSYSYFVKLMSSGFSSIIVAGYLC